MDAGVQILKIWMGPFGSEFDQMSLPLPLHEECLSSVTHLFCVTTYKRLLQTFELEVPGGSVSCD